MSDLILMRVDFLKQFIKYIETIGDEDIIDYWLMYGVPDEADDDMLNEIASDDDSWTLIVIVFSKCCKMAGVM